MRTRAGAIGTRGMRARRGNRGKARNRDPSAAPRIPTAARAGPDTLLREDRVRRRGRHLRAAVEDGVSGGGEGSYGRRSKFSSASVMVLTAFSSAERLASLRGSE